MKIILIGPGFKPIPPVGWGAIESLVWDYYENLKKCNIDAMIINNTNLKQIVEVCNQQSPDIVHIMYDDYIVIAPHLRCRKILYTSHYAYITHPHFAEAFPHYFHHIFKQVIENQNYIKLHAISSQIADVYKQHGYQGHINVLCNGAREDLFAYTLNPEFPHNSIYVAKIEKRKAQYKYQHIPAIDFVGNYQDSSFDRTNPNYLGEWNKPTLYKNLTNYGNLVLLSEGEADPLVVKEALIAGLGVVVSECATANIDTTYPFISVIPNAQLNNISYITEKITENRNYSVQHREDIREYALQHFAWNHIVQTYIKLCAE